MANNNDQGRKQGEGGGQGQGGNNNPGQKTKATGDDQERSSGKSAAHRGEARGSAQGQNFTKENNDTGRGDSDR
jgi:hypothetical protein